MFKEFDYYSEALEEEKELMEILEKGGIRLEECDRSSIHNRLVGRAGAVPGPGRSTGGEKVQDTDPGIGPGNAEAFHSLCKKAEAFARWAGCNLILESDERHFGKIIMSSEIILVAEDTPEDLKLAFWEMVCRAEAVVLCPEGKEGTVGIEMTYSL